jgi:hypothetical protein
MWRLRWTAKTPYLKEKRNILRILVWKSLGKRSLGRLSSVRENDFQTNLRKLKNGADPGFCPMATFGAYAAGSPGHTDRMLALAFAALNLCGFITES